MNRASDLVEFQAERAQRELRLSKIEALRRVGGIGIIFIAGRVEIDEICKQYETGHRIERR